MLTSSFHVQFLAPVKTGTLTATGTLLHQGTRFLSAEAKAYDGAGRIVTTGLGSFVKSNLLLKDL